MPSFNILCRVDAYVDYVAEVEADDAQEATITARQNAADYEWVKQGDQEFDARFYVALTPGGDEIESTQVGDF